jgi:hypothetical protein
VRLGELAMLAGELGGQLEVLFLALGQLLLQLLDFGLICIAIARSQSNKI